MTNQEIKIIKVKSCEKGDYEKLRGRIKDHKGLPRYGADFRKIEDAPNSRFEREVLTKITVEPEGQRKLIEDEDRAMLHRAIQEAGLSALERQCIGLNLEGYEPHEITNRLHRGRGVIKMTLIRARKKLIKFVRRNYVI